MSYINWKIERTPISETGYDTSSTETLTGYYDVILNTNVGEGRDSFSLKLTNFNNEFDNYFKANDKITIARVVNSTTVTTDDIKMIGTLKAVPYDKSFSKNTVRLEGYNFSETIMEAIVFVEPVGITVPDAIKLALENAGAKNKNFEVTWNTGNDTAIAALTFPTVGEERFYNKTLKSILEKYSNNLETNNGQFYWFIDNNNTLVWRQESGIIDATFNESTELHKSIKIKYDIKDVKNFIILKGGFDPAGKQIQNKYVEWASVAKHGNKYLFVVSKNNTAEELVETDRQGKQVTTTDRYPEDLTAASYTTKWKATVADGTTTTKYGIAMNRNQAVTINEGSESANKKAYNEVIRVEVKYRLYKEGEQTALDLRYGKLGADIAFSAGTKTWGLGQNIDVTIPAISSSAKTMRITDLQLASGIDTYTLKEDEGTI